MYQSIHFKISSFHKTDFRNEGTISLWWVLMRSRLIHGTGKNSILQIQLPMMMGTLPTQAIDADFVDTKQITVELTFKTTWSDPRLCLLPASLPCLLALPHWLATETISCNTGIAPIFPSCSGFSLLPLLADDDVSTLQKEILILQTCRHANIVAYHGSYLWWWASDLPGTQPKPYPTTSMPNQGTP